MKLLTSIIAAALTLTNAHAISTALWAEDSPGGFNLTLAGTGLDFVTVDSPSGLWELTSRIWGEFKPFDYYGPTPSLWVSNDASATFLGNDSLPYMWTWGYSDMPGNLGTPIVNGANWNTHGMFSPEFNDWKGVALFQILTTPNLDDTSQWTWVANLSGHGTAIPRNVAEGGSVWLMMAFASGILLCFRPKSA